MTEQSLTTNAKHLVVCIGDTVHRPTSWLTSAVHDPLKHLEKIEFAYSPKLIGFDNEGRELRVREHYKVYARRVLLKTISG